MAAVRPVAAADVQGAGSELARDDAFNGASQRKPRLSWEPAGCSQRGAYGLKSKGRSGALDLRERHLGSHGIRVEVREDSGD